MWKGKRNTMNYRPQIICTWQAMLKTEFNNLQTKFTLQFIENSAKVILGLQNVMDVWKILCIRAHGMVTLYKFCLLYKTFA